ncbi:MAG: hypothetical protein GY895_23055 [Phycisphaera sp.]|nr:hypothetical protein [Phycisphaera sp.]
MMHRLQPTIESRVSNLHAWRFGVTSVLAGALLLGCTNRQVKVEMVAGETGPERIFETNRTDRDEIGRLSEAYETAPTERANGRDGVRFEGVFAERELPSEIGNRNGWSTLPGSFGTAYYYVEQFGAARDDWSAFRDRMNAGELWIRFAISFFESRIDGDEERAEWRRFAEEELLPDAMSAFLRFNAGGYVQQGQRIDTRFRPPQERGPRTDDEWFQVQVFAPLVGFAVERGWVEPWEAQLTLLSGIDGWVSAGERAWTRKELADPIVKRSVGRFVPGADPGEIGPGNQKLILTGLAFLWWVNTSKDAVELMLESAAIPEVDKARLRKGDRSIDLPGPFGIPIGGGERPLESEVVLRTEVEPFLTNGTWDESLGTVSFTTRIYPPAERRRMTPPVFHANWAVPDASVQRAIFGGVELVGQGLAESAFWERMFDDDRRAEWTNALEAAKAAGSPAPLRSFIESLDGEDAESLPAPEELRDLVFRASDA